MGKTEQEKEKAKMAKKVKKAKKGKHVNAVPPEGSGDKSSIQPGGSRSRAIGYLPQPAARLEEDKLGQENRDAGQKYPKPPENLDEEKIEGEEGNLTFSTDKPTEEEHIDAKFTKMTKRKNENDRNGEYEIPAPSSSFQKPADAQADGFCSPALRENPLLPKHRELDLDKMPESSSTGTTNKDTLKHSPAASSSSTNETTLKPSAPNEGDMGTGMVAASFSGGIELKEFTFDYIYNTQLTYVLYMHEDIGPAVRYLTIFTTLIQIAMTRDILDNGNYYQGMLDRSCPKPNEPNEAKPNETSKSYLAREHWKARLLLIRTAMKLRGNYKFKQVETKRESLIAGLSQFIIEDDLPILQNKSHVPMRYLQRLLYVGQNRELFSNFVLQIIFESRLEAGQASSEIKYLPDELGLKSLGNEISYIIDQRNYVAKKTGLFKSPIHRYEFFTNTFRILTEINWKLIYPDATQEEIKAILAKLIGANKEVVTMLNEISNYIEMELEKRITLLEQQLDNRNCRKYKDRHPTHRYNKEKEIAEIKAENSDPEHKKGYLTAKRNIWLREHIKHLAKAAKSCGIPEGEDFSTDVKLSPELEEKYKHTPSPSEKERQQLRAENKKLRTENMKLLAEKRQQREIDEQNREILRALLECNALDASIIESQGNTIEQLKQKDVVKTRLFRQLMRNKMENNTAGTEASGVTSEHEAKYQRGIKSITEMVKQTWDVGSSGGCKTYRENVEARESEIRERDAEVQKLKAGVQQLEAAVGNLKLQTHYGVERLQSQQFQTGELFEAVVESSGAAKEPDDRPSVAEEDDLASV